MISVSINGKILTTKVIDKQIKLKSTVDYRIFGAYYHTPSNDPKAIQNGCPSEPFLIIISDPTDKLHDSCNIIITPSKSIPYENTINLHCLWYHPTEHKFIGIERNHYHLVSVAFDADKAALCITDKYRKVTSTGIQHYFYDPDTDMIVIYKQLMASSKFKNELIFLPVSSQLMLAEK